MAESNTKTLAKNRKAFFNYEVIERLEAGIVLQGTEVKSVKEGKLSIKECYGRFKDGEIFLIGMHISEFKNGGVFNHELTRSRKLLMHKSELRKWEDKVKRNVGLTIVPLHVYQKKHLIKVDIGLCKGKREFEKRASIKDREVKREIDRTIKNFRR